MKKVMKGIEVDVQYFEKLHELHNDFPFFPERMKIEKAKKILVNLHDKTECYTHKKFKASIKSHISFKISS